MWLKVVQIKHRMRLEFTREGFASLACFSLLYGDALRGMVITHDSIKLNELNTKNLRIFFLFIADFLASSW